MHADNILFHLHACGRRSELAGLPFDPTQPPEIYYTHMYIQSNFCRGGWNGRVDNELCICNWFLSRLETAEAVQLKRIRNEIASLEPGQVRPGHGPGTSSTPYKIRLNVLHLIDQLYFAAASIMEWSEGCSQCFFLFFFFSCTYFRLLIAFTLILSKHT